MRKVNINAYEVGLVCKNREYQRYITTGSYWFWKNEVVQVYDIMRPFEAPVDLGILLQDESLADILQVVEVAENEIALQYENGLLKRVLTAGRYAYWKSVINYMFVKADISKLEITEAIDRTTLLGKLVAPYVRTVSLENYEKALLFVDGKYAGLLDSGVYTWWKNNINVQIVRIDTRQQQLEINGQEILTRDKAMLRLNAWAQYRVADLEKAVLQNKEYDKQLYVAFQLALREYVGGYTLDELLDRKDSLAAFVLQKVKEDATKLGVEVSDFGIRDIILPGDVKEIMNQVLIAEKKAQANTIMRREETASTRSLLNTAKLMEENTMLWKLKEMEYVEKIAEKIGNISVSGDGMLLEKLKSVLTGAK